MAIKIPSKNIYEMNNPKIRDNVIDNVSVEQTVVKPNNDYETPVFNEKYIPTILEQKNTLNREIVGEIAYTGADFGYSGIWIANAEILNQKVSNIIIKIPRIQKNKLIQSILYDKDKDNKNQIKYTVYGKIQKGKCNRNVGWESPSGILTPNMTANITSVGTISFDNYTEESETTTFNYNSNIVASISGTPAEDILFEKEVVAKLEPLDISNVISYNSTENEFVLSFDVMSEITVARLGGMDFVMGISGTLTLSGEFEKYIPTEIEITIYGNTIGIDLTDGSVTYGGGKKPYSLSRNELLQDSGFMQSSLVEINTLVSNIETQEVAGITFYYFYLVVDDADKKFFNIGDKIIYNDISATVVNFVENAIVVQTQEQLVPVDDSSIGKSIIVKIQGKYLPLTQFLAQNILEQYEKGKETATLLCDINDYYDENGEKAIDIKTENMSFRLHDKVIPYVFGANGQDQPMSKYQDGSPKVFEIVGSNIIYDGAIWQEISLQEIDKFKNS